MMATPYSLSSTLNLVALSDEQLFAELDLKDLPDADMLRYSPDQAKLFGEVVKQLMQRVRLNKQLKELIFRHGEALDVLLANYSYHQVALVFGHHMGCYLKEATLRRYMSQWRSANSAASRAANPAASSSQPDPVAAAASPCARKTSGTGSKLGPQQATQTHMPLTSPPVKSQVEGQVQVRSATPAAEPASASYLPSSICIVAPGGRTRPAASPAPILAIPHPAPSPVATLK